jgi:3-hydroxy-3-methylglutaryl CoA synthase/uncharacterized OB-fold protein
MPRGIETWGAYVPWHRLRHDVIAQALGSGGGKGSRSVASFDEDSTTMGVEAARLALSAAGPFDERSSVVLSTTAPAYGDKTNATTVHAALGLAPDVAAYDALGSARSGVGALRMALAQGSRSLVVAADVRTGLPGSADERSSGDAAAAFVVSDGPDVAAELIGVGSASAEFLDRWRTPGEVASRVWEERFSEGPLLHLSDSAWSSALKSAALDDSAVGAVAVVGPNARAVAGVRKRRAWPERLVADEPGTGWTGAAHAGLALAGLLDSGSPGDVIAVQSVVDGSDVLVFRLTDALADKRPPASLSEQLAVANDSLNYMRFLSWRGLLTPEPPRRPDPDRPAAPPSWRSVDFKFGFSGSRCLRCGRVSLPPQRVCYHCGSIDETEAVAAAGTRGTVANFTVDRLAFTPSPPMIAGLVDLASGGRFQGEFADVSLDELAVGMEMELTFRRLFSAGGVHDYFWKARPLRRNR